MQHYYVLQEQQASLLGVECKCITLLHLMYMLLCIYHYVNILFLLCRCFAGSLRGPVLRLCPEIARDIIADMSRDCEGVCDGVKGQESKGHTPNFRTSSLIPAVGTLEQNTKLSQ